MKDDRLLEYAVDLVDETALLVSEGKAYDFHLHAARIARDWSRSKDKIPPPIAFKLLAIVDACEKTRRNSELKRAIKKFIKQAQGLGKFNVKEEEE